MALRLEGITRQGNRGPRSLPRGQRATRQPSLGLGGQGIGKSTDRPSFQGLDCRWHRIGHDRRPALHGHTAPVERGRHIRQGQRCAMGFQILSQVPHLPFQSGGMARRQRQQQGNLGPIARGRSQGGGGWLITGQNHMHIRAPRPKGTDARPTLTHPGRSRRLQHKGTVAEVQDWVRRCAMERGHEGLVTHLQRHFDHPRHPRSGFQMANVGLHRSQRTEVRLIRVAAKGLV